MSTPQQHVDDSNRHLGEFVPDDSRELDLEKFAAIDDDDREDFRHGDGLRDQPDDDDDNDSRKQQRPEQLPAEPEQEKGKTSQLQKQPQQPHQRRPKDIVKYTVAEYLARAAKLLSVKRFHDALTLLGKSSSLKPESSALVLLFVLKAEAYAGLLDFGSGISCLRSALLSSKFDSEKAQIRARLVCYLDTAAVALLQRGRAAQALAHAQEAAEIDGGVSLEVLLHRCLCLVGMQRLDDAATQLFALKYAADNVGHTAIALECTVLSVHLAIVQRRFEEAKQFLEFCNRHNTRDDKSASQQQQQQQEEDDDADKAEDDEFAKQFKKFMLARCDDDQDLSEHPRIIALEREFDSAFKNFVATAKRELDVEALTVAVNCFPNDPELYRARAEALVEKGAFARGIQDYFKVIEKASGKDEAAQIAVARTLHSVAYQLVQTNNDLAGAITYLTESWKWNPKAIEVILMRGDCLLQLREHEAALGDFRRAQELDPSNPDVCHRISELHSLWGTHLFAEKKYDKAEEEYTRAIEISPFEPRYFYFRCKCRLASARCAEDHLLAVRDLLEVRKLGTKDPEILILVSQLCPDETLGGSCSSHSCAAGDAASAPAAAASSSSSFSSASELIALRTKRQQKQQQSAIAKMMSDLDGGENAEMKLLRQNRQELLASPIDSKKLREASAPMMASELSRKLMNGDGPIWLKHGETFMTTKNRLQRHDFTVNNSEKRAQQQTALKDKFAPKAAVLLKKPTEQQSSLQPPVQKALLESSTRQQVVKSSMSAMTAPPEKKRLMPPQQRVALPPIFGSGLL